LVDPNTRQGKRTPVTLKIKFKSETLEQFIERYAVDVSQGGIFIRTKDPLAVGTQMKFEFQLRDASPLIAGEGTVVWTRENDPSRPAIAPGMGVRFDRLADGSQVILERILAEKLKQAPQRPQVDTTKPPLFTDTPTRVAPAPMQEALLGGESHPRLRRQSDDLGQSDSHTPLPKPMPFHSDADEFPDEAFEEATKVRALDELIAQTAEGTATADELAARRNGRGVETQSESASDRAATHAESAEAAQLRRDRNHPATGRTQLLGSRGDGARSSAEAYEAPDLPNPPEPAVRVAGKLLDTSPSPRIEAGALSGLAAFNPETAGKTRLGVGVESARGRASTPPIGHPLGGEPAFTSSLATSSQAQAPLGMRAVAAEQTQPARMPPIKAKSSAPIVVMLLVLVAIAGAAVWFVVLRPHAVESANPPAPGSAAPGSAIAATGSAATPRSAEATGSAGSAAPPAALVDTVIASSVEGARVEIKGTDQVGPAPFTARLEVGKPYKVRITAKGFAASELDVKGGDDKPMAKLVAKPRLLSIASEPPGALILVDSVATGRTTPSDVELSAAQAAKKTVKVQLRKSGYRSVERVIDITKLTEDDIKMTATIEEKLATQPQPSSPSRPSTPRPPAAGSDSEPATTPPPDGPVTTPSGEAPPSAAPPSPPPAAATPPAPSQGSSTEPEPSFNKQPQQ
jgi:uncharacterized protein (TIGR02266 family)